MYSMITADVVRTLLLADMVGLSLLALVYLRHRRMTWQGYCCWALLAVVVPVIGPFLVIAKRPGDRNPSASVIKDFQTLLYLSHRLLPNFQPGKKLGTLERARMRRKSRQQNKP
jgi:hypothetical protein